MARKALLIGINQYREPSIPDLKGCVSDVRNFSEVLTSYFNFELPDIRLLTDDSAVREMIFHRLEWLVGNSGPGDLLVFYFSGHGSQTVDRNGDELDDHKDEILCLHDMHHRNASSYIVDDDLNAVLRKKHRDATLVVVLDSCHSGTATRGFADFGTRLDSLPQGGSFARFVPPPEEFIHRIRAQEHHDRDGRRRRTLFSQENGGFDHILLSACRDFQQAAEAMIEGTHQGAFTHYMCETIRRANGELTYHELMERVGNSLRFSLFTQTPNLNLPKRPGHDRIFYAGEKSDEAPPPILVGGPKAPALRLKRGRRKAEDVELHHPATEPDIAAMSSSFEGVGMKSLGGGDASFADIRGEVRELLGEMGEQELELIGWFYEEPEPLKEEDALSAKSLGQAERVFAGGTLELEGENIPGALLLEQRDGVFVLHEFQADDAGKLTLSLPKRNIFSRAWSAVKGVVHYVLKLPKKIVRAGLRELEIIKTAPGLFYFPRYDGSAFAPENHVPVKDMVRRAPGLFDQPRNIVVFIHGFISNVSGSFGDLSPKKKEKAPHGDFVRRLQERDWVVLGQNYLTVSESPIDNARALADALAHIENLNEHKFTFIAYSRGALTARAFLTYVNGVKNNRMINVERLLTFGSPNSGTDLAVSILNLVNVFLNAGRFLKLSLPWKILVGLLKYATDKDVIPGAMAMQPDSAFLKALEKKEKDDDVYEGMHCGYARSNFEPESKDALWQKLLDGVVDSTVFKKGNDLIVNTAHMDLPKYCHVGEDDIISFTASDSSNHFEYFSRKRTVDYLNSIFKTG